MLILPWELIDKIVSYTLDPSVRPYLFDIRLTKDITMEHGVKAGLRHINSVKALQHAWYDKAPSYIGNLYADCWHIR